MQKGKKDKNSKKRKYEKPILTKYSKIEKFFRGWAAPGAPSPAG